MRFGYTKKNSFIKFLAIIFVMHLDTLLTIIHIGNVITFKLGTYVNTIFLLKSILLFCYQIENITKPITSL